MLFILPVSCQRSTTMGCPSSYPHHALIHPIIFPQTPSFPPRFLQLPFTPLSPHIPFFPLIRCSPAQRGPQPLPAEFPGPLTITEMHTTLRISGTLGFLVELGTVGVTVEVRRVVWAPDWSLNQYISSDWIINKTSICKQSYEKTEKDIIRKKTTCRLF